MVSKVRAGPVKYMNDQMNGLYPIIRRVRRPLVSVVEGAPGGADAKPVPASELKEPKRNDESNQPAKKSNGKKPQ